jgi:hypothetical protein
MPSVMKHYRKVMKLYGGRVMYGAKSKDALKAYPKPLNSQRMRGEHTPCHFPTPTDEAVAGYAYL